MSALVIVALDLGDDPATSLFGLAAVLFLLAAIFSWGKGGDDS